MDKTYIIFYSWLLDNRYKIDTKLRCKLENGEISFKDWKIWLYRECVSFTLKLNNKQIIERFIETYGTPSASDLDFIKIE